MIRVEPVFPLAEALYEGFADDIPAIVAGTDNPFIDALTPTSTELIKFWFQREYSETRHLNFHQGQRDAILAVIYAHEVLSSGSLRELYAKVAPGALLDGNILGEVTETRNLHPKYAAKMATGTGKTWVLNALLLWQYLNRIASPNDERFSANFLIVAPGLIVYDRLLDSFQGKLRGDVRDFTTSDIFLQRDLFVPENLRDRVFSFLRSSVVTKSDIGKKLTGSGLIAITNWHLLAGAEDPDFIEAETQSPGRDIDARASVRELLPVAPSLSAGNALEVLDRRYLRGSPLESLKELGDLVVFNDEAHHIHPLKRGEEITDVEWQRSLDAIAASKGRRFVQIDFSATPYNESGSGKNRVKRYFPHIVTDFSLPAAMRLGLVKALALDKRSEIAALPIDWAAVRDERGRVTGLSEGQRVMLRAGLKKLKILEDKFTNASPDKHPKLLVICEDTSVSPFVEDFLLESGLAKDDVLRVDSGRKEQLGRREWEPIRERLFDVDGHPRPRVIVSVLMLREGFDVNNICVIVPLRSSGASILLEQTVGRGLRLMWRGNPAIDELKRETRDRIALRQEPHNYFDVLFIVEHPAFERFYDELLGGELVGSTGDQDGSTRVTGDLEPVGLRDGFAYYDFEIPFVLRDVEEELTAPTIDPLALPASRFPADILRRTLGSGERFASHDAQTGIRFGDFRVDGGVMTATGYNDYLSRITARIAQAHARAFVTTTQKFNDIAEFPVLQAYKPLLAGWIDKYIRNRMFDGPFDPLRDEGWRLLLIQEVSEEIAGLFGTALVELQSNHTVRDPEVVYRRPSEIGEITVRRSASVEVAKCIYPRLPFPLHGGGLEKLFIEWADRDGRVEALIKLHEYKHDFMRRPYLKADGMPAQYSPDFLVRTRFDVYVVETKAQSALSDENVRRKERAALAWCDQINLLDASQRDGREWHYVLLGEPATRRWHDKRESVAALLHFTRLRRASAEDPATLI